MIVGGEVRYSLGGIIHQPAAPVRPSRPDRESRHPGCRISANGAHLDRGRPGSQPAPAEAAMRTLIDGYNLMFADGLPAKRLGPDAFRKARQRFLDKLARGLGPFEAQPDDRRLRRHRPPRQPARRDHLQGDDDPLRRRRRRRRRADRTAHRRALDPQDAPRRLDRPPHPHGHGEAQGPGDDRRRIPGLPRRPASRGSRSRPLPPAASGPRDRPLSPQESAYWLEEFGGLDDEPDVRELSRPDSFGPTDAEIAEIEREVDEESW